jgi:hypothetical protein
MPVLLVAGQQNQDVVSQYLLPADRRGYSMW